MCPSRWSLPACSTNETWWVIKNNNEDNKLEIGREEDVDLEVGGQLEVGLGVGGEVVVDLGIDRDMGWLWECVRREWWLW